MGVEIVEIIIVPEVLICLLAAFLFWLAAVRTVQQPTAIGYTLGFVPLIAGFAVSMVSLTLLTYIESAAAFTWLVQHGHYTESDRALYLPNRVVGQLVVNLVFVLPIICFIVVPCTMRLIRISRLTLRAIALRAAVGWIALALVNELFNLGVFTPPYALSDILTHTGFAVLISGMPIPLAALWLFRRRLTSAGAAAD
jgi:hypothetical protein